MSILLSAFSRSLQLPLLCEVVPGNYLDVFDIF